LLSASAIAHELLPLFDAQARKLPSAAVTERHKRESANALQNLSLYLWQICQG
jgi:hypothetical protein